MEAINFKGGLSGVSSRYNALESDVLPKHKNTLSPSGEHVVTYLWEVMDFAKSFEYKEQKFALQFSKKQPALTPEEFTYTENEAMKELHAFLEQTNNVEDITMINKAIALLNEAQNLRYELKMSKSALYAA